MKRLIFTILGVLIFCGLFAQEIPQKISYQGNLFENGYAVTGTKNITFTIDSWSETKSVSVNDGLYSVTLGETTPIPTSIFDNTSTVELEISVEGISLSPQTKMLSVPYAYKAEKAVNTDKIAGNPVSGTPSTNQILKWNGSQWESSDDSDNQALSISGSDLSISGGNTVTLPSSSGGITQLDQGSGIILNPNPITSTGTISFQNPFNGDFSATNTISTDSPSSSFDGGDIVADDDLIADDDIEVGDNAYIEDVIYLNDDANSTGGLGMKGSDGNEVFGFGFSSGTSGKGGAVATYYSGSQRSFLGTMLDSENGYGALQLFDHFGQLTIHLNAETGVIAGGSKQFRVVHPQDNTKEIVYTSIEGPEAAAYFRGTANLINGTIYIEYPEHFNLVINKTTITVNLTPLSADSKGLAVIKKSEFGFEVVELFQGNGNYEFDYEVKGVRQGYEDYQVIQDKVLQSSIDIPVKEEKGRED